MNPKKQKKELTKAPLKKKSGLRENLEAIVLAIILALFIRTFVVQAFKIPSGSMLETLQIGDHILVNKFIYGIKIPFTKKTLVALKNPKRKDIIVFEFPVDPDKDFIKRVIAVGGDEVQIQDKKVYVNGQWLKEAYAEHKDPSLLPGSRDPRDNFGPYKVPANMVFVMGDNRDHSFDSRYWGPVKLSAVKGKAFLIYWSWNNEAFGVRWRRLGKTIR